MPQPPPRKVKPSAVLKTLHSDQISKLQAKHQQECDLLEDIRTFSRQRSVIEKEYAQALLKLTGQLLKRDFQAMPDLSSDDGKEHRTAMAVWRVILEETDTMAKRRLQAADTYLERIGEPVKPLKNNKVQSMKKVLPQLQTVQGEVSQTVLEMVKAQKTYNLDETQAYDARLKAKDAEEKLNRKSKGIFTSLASLQKNYAKLKSRSDACESKATESRNEYLLCMAAANVHHIRYFTTDLPNLMEKLAYLLETLTKTRQIEVLDGEIFERIQEYFAVYGNTAQEISCYENRSFNKIVEQTAMINRNFDLKCFLYTNHLFTDLVQYQFEPCLEDQCNKISNEHNASHQLEKEARKWATKIAKENKAIKDYQKALKALGTGDRVSESGSTEGVSQDPEAKMEEIQQNIRRAETARAKAEARIEALRLSGVNVDEWLSSANVDSLGVDNDADIPRTPSRTSVRTDSSGHTDDHEEPTYTHYDEDDDFLDETFDVSVGDFSLKNTSSQYPMKCRSMYEFKASNPDELDMVENEELEIIANGDGDGWVRAKNSQGVIGFIPENYIIMSQDGVSNSTTVDQPDVVVSSEVRVSYSSQDDSELNSPPPPDTPISPPAIQVDDTEMADFPPPPATPLSPPSSNDNTQEVTSYSSGDIEVQQTTNAMNDMQLPLDVSEGVWVRALYDYEATSADEISFAEGTMIRIMRKDVNGIDDGFWEGEVNGAVGIFPSLVVEELATPGSIQEFPSPLQSPPDYMPPPPVTVTAATPESETPPTPLANGSGQEPTDDKTEDIIEQYKKKLNSYKTGYYRGYASYNHQPMRTVNTSYNQSIRTLETYDPRYDDDGEESIV